MSLELRQWVELSLSRLAGLLGTAEGLHYIGGSDVLPPPIDREQERALLLRVREGDQEARNTLIEHNLRLVAHIVKKY